MAIGERICFFRNKKGAKQKNLGQVVGFPERSADVRMAQYETGSRTPKADLTRTLADFFEVSTDALTVPDIDSDIGLMHTLFALEDIRGLTIGEIDGEICLRLGKSKGTTYHAMFEMLRSRPRSWKPGRLPGKTTIAGATITLKTALFVIISDTDDTFNFVVSILYTQLFNLLCDKADDHTTMARQAGAHN